VVLGITLTLIYLANGREMDSGDTLPAKLLPLAILRGDGPFLDRFDRPAVMPPVGVKPSDSLPYYVARRRGHLLSTYPLAPGLLALPFYWPQVLVLDWLRPGWDQNDELLNKYTARMAKSAAAATTALTGVALLHLLRALGFGWPALLATLAAALGSPLWVQSSQSLWLHAPAALALTLSMALLVPQPVSRWRLFLAGLAAAVLVCVRANDVVFAVILFAWVVRYHFRDLPWFLPMPVLMGAALLSYNYWFFGAASGGYAMEGMEEHGLRVTYSNPLFDGMAGTLVSPSRGLFLFCPWVALALVAAPGAVARWVNGRSVVWWMAWGLIPYLILLSKYHIWWGGASFGPRYWADVMPLFAVMLACGLAWSWSRYRTAFPAFVAAVLFACGIQAIGAFSFPSTWYYWPNDVDYHPERCWDWRDNEVRRCLIEGPYPESGRPPPKPATKPSPAGARKPEAP
jgi:hypothetical protein